ncbi:Arabinanase/levansucrase/invertase [Mycena capillaripes]|nr:Arabinanase/levansucrase/invertase [Mycena capillaripes]
MVLVFAALALSALVLPALAATSWIVPGAVWLDTAGNKIDAHGGMIIKPGSVWYWIGYSVNAGITPIIYSSEDLLNWDNRGIANSIQQMWRPKLILAGGRFNIFGQVNRLTQGMTATSITGPYTLYGSGMSIPPDALTYSDCGPFVDTDAGQTYWITSADHNTLSINHVTNTTNPTLSTRVASLALGAYEGPALFKVGSIYFLIVSSKTGWRPNPDKVFWATSLAGPWSGGTDVAPEANNTYNSQSTYVAAVTGTSQTTYIFMGDAWDSTGSAASNYMWTPLSVSTSAHTATLQYFPFWKVNPTTGVVTTSTTGKRYEAEDADMAGRAAVTDCSSCVSKRAVHRVDDGSTVTFTCVEGLGNGERQWVALHYTVNNATGGDAYVYVNDEKFNVRDLNVRAGLHHVVPISVFLEKSNNITFAVHTSNPQFEAHLDGIEVLDGTEEEIEVKL